MAAGAGAFEELLLGGALLDDLCVQLVRGVPDDASLLGLGELLVDQRLERVERLRAAQAATVDEERRRARGTEVTRQLLIGVDRRLVLVAVERSP